MPAFYPSSYGGSTRRALREENPCHEPGGKAEGGRFAKKGSTGCADATVASTGQPMLVDTKTGHPKFEEPDKKGLQIERPKDAKKADTGSGHKLAGFDDVSPEGNADDALAALGVRMTAEEIAEGLVSAIEGETFSVNVEAGGASGSETYDGPDPDSVRSQYDEYQMDAFSEAESNMHASEMRSYERYSEDAFYTTADLVNVELAARKGEDSFHDAAAWDRATIELTDADKDAINHTEALAEKIFAEGSGIVNEEGFKARGAGEKVKAIVEKYLADNPDATFVALPVTADDEGGGYLDEDYRKEHSRWFNDRDGYDNWRDDGQGDSAGDDVQPFEEWYSDRYGHSPDKYGQYGEIEYDGDSTSVTFTFSGSKGSEITRTVSMKDGELHVHHDLFRAAGTGDGLSKQFFQGALPTYDKMGVQSLSTSANIDIGAYTWARYGFQADSPHGLARRVTARAKELFKDTGLFDDNDWRAFQSVVDPNSPTAIWDVVDAKYYTTPEKAMALVDNWMRHESTQRAAISNKKTREEAAKGIVSVGRLTMIDDNRNMQWDAHLDLHDEESVKRMEGYIGVWREQRQGFRADPIPGPPSGRMLARATRQAAAAPPTPYTPPAPERDSPTYLRRVKTFDSQMTALNKTPLGRSLTDHQRMRMRDLMGTQGFDFGQAKDFVIPIGQRDSAAKKVRRYADQKRNFDQQLKVFNRDTTTPLTDKQRTRVRELMLNKQWNFWASVAHVAGRTR